MKKETHRVAAGRATVEFKVVTLIHYFDQVQPILRKYISSTIYALSFITGMLLDSTNNIYLLSCSEDLVNGLYSNTINYKNLVINKLNVTFLKLFYKNSSGKYQISI